jgi:hypothetical protein
MRTDTTASEEEDLGLFLVKLKLGKVILTVGFDFGGDIFRRLLKVVVVFRRTSDRQF